MNSTPGSIPPLVLALLTAGVVLAHALVVQNTVLSLGSAGRTSDMRAGERVFITREVPLQAAVAARPAPPPTPPVRAVATPRQPAAKAPRPSAATTSVRPPAPESAPSVAQMPEAGVAVAQAAVTAASAPEQPAPITEVLPAPTAQVLAPVPAAPTAAVAETPPPETAKATPPMAGAAPVAAAAPVPAQGTTPEPRSYQVPPNTRLKFDATGMRGKLKYFASGELSWLHDGNTYEAKLQLSAFLVASRVLSSTGALTPEGLAPTRYADKYRSETAAHFERARGRVVFSTNAPEAALLPGAQDQLSIFLQLASMLAGEPARYPPGSTITMPTVGTRISEPWTFTVDATETLSLPGGDQPALRLTRLPRRDFDQKVEIWLAPALAYLPARIRITQGNGDFIDQQWRSTEKP